MKRMLAAKIAWRYLWSKKSHSAVSAISIVSICGMAVATAAIVCVLSVFNGFRDILGDKLDTMVADVVVTPSHGKVFPDTDSIATAIRKAKGVAETMPVVSDNALVIYDSKEMPVILKGVDMTLYPRMAAIDSVMLDHTPFPRVARSIEDTESPAIGVASIGVASRLNAFPGETLMIFAPKREGRINTANPASSFLIDSMRIDGVFQSRQSQFDDNMLICDIETAKALFQYDTEATAIEVMAKPGINLQSLAQNIATSLGPSATVKDRFRLQEINFRMVEIEKWVSFLLLFLILVIASFNIISSLSMLVLEKENAIHTLTALGMPAAGIGSVFRWESLFVAFAGGLAGIATGLILCLLQEHFGLVKLSGDPSSLIISTYPVKVMLTDILLTLIPITAIGLATALITGAFARSRIATK